MEGVQRIDQLADEWGKRESQMKAAQKHPLGLLWMWYLKLKLEEVKRKHGEEERYLNFQCQKKSKGPFSGIHG